MSLPQNLPLRRFASRIVCRGKSLGAWAVFLAVLLAVPMVAAQETTATIRGRIVDAQGAPLAGAAVEVRDERTGIVRSFASNDAGAFLATRLSPGGPYKVTVNGTRTVVVESIAVADVYNLKIDMQAEQSIEEIVVVGQSLDIVDVAAGPAATFSTFQMETAVAFNRDILDVYGIDPRINVDNEDDGFEVNCAGKHPRFNSVTLDGVSQNDRFGLNSNGYSTAVGMPFPFDAIAQVAVELAPFDVTYGGFSACNINAVTKSGANEWHGNAFYDYTSDGLRGTTLGGDSRDFSTPPFTERKTGFSIGGPLIQDKLFFFAAYENSSKPRFLARGYAGSGIGVEREWFSQADHDRIVAIANNAYGYDPGGQPGDGLQEADKVMARLDWNLNQNHNVAFIFNYFDGFQDRDSDGDSDEFEFANHFYQKGAESTTYTVKLASNWSDAFSTELFLSRNEMNDSQVTVGPKDFGDFQIGIGRNTVYLGADDSRQANRLNTDSDFAKLSAKYLVGNNVFTGGYEREKLTIFNQFVQHARGGEYDFYDESANNPPHCAALTAQGRFEDPACDLSGIDRFELGRPSRIYYGSGGGSNDPADAAANFSNTLNALYVQDEIFFDAKQLTLVAGLRYEFFTSGDRPTHNQTFTDANGGLSNNANIDGLSLLMPRVGVTWQVNDDLSLRGGVGRYSGGNPNVWISNAWSNDGLTNVQLTLNNFAGTRSVLDGSIPLNGNQPGRSVPTELHNRVAATTAANANDSYLVLIDPDYVQPSEWKFAFGATLGLPGGVQADIDYLHTELKDSAYYVDLSQEVVGTTTAGMPIYAYTNGRDNFMLTNSDQSADSDIASITLRKEFDAGLDVLLGYAYTDSNDVSPMTSSVAGSNFDNLALNDINNLTAATSNYEVPHRFSLRASYGKDLFGEGLETRLTVFAYVQEGQPQSYVMGSRDLEGDGYYGRHLLYVPTGASDPNVVYGSNFPVDEFFAWVAREGLSSGFQPRNGQHAPWSKRIDFRIDQKLPTGIGRAKGKLYFKMYNFGNFLNNEWGKVWDAQFFSVQVVDSRVNSDGQYVFNNFSDRTITDLLEIRSLWSARLGIEIDF